MVFIASSLKLGTSAIIRTSDRDILIIYLAKKNDILSNRNLWLDVRINSHNARRLIEVNSLHQTLAKIFLTHYLLYML